MGEHFNRRVRTVRLDLGQEHAEREAIRLDQQVRRSPQRSCPPSKQQTAASIAVLIAQAVLAIFVFWALAAAAIDRLLQ